MLKLDHKVVIGYTTINVIGVTTVFVKYPKVIAKSTKLGYYFLRLTVSISASLYFNYKCIR